MIPRGRAHILCVDDQPIVLEWLKTCLEPFNYEVEIAQNGYRALRQVIADPQRFAVIIIDLRMPGMDGFSLIQEARAAGYDGKFVVYAAAISTEAQERLRELRVSRVIEKPGRKGDIVDAVRTAESGF